jgi:CheY-like chemotaxis protein
MLDLECIIETEIIPLVEIKRHQPDLILLDYRLSNGLGHLFSHQIKNTPSTKDICIILMSAANQIEKIAEESHADYFISKPFDLDEITQLIFRCLYGTAA